MSHGTLEEGLARSLYQALVALPSFWLFFTNLLLLCKAILASTSTPAIRSRAIFQSAPSIAAHVLEVKDLQEQAYARGKMSMVEHARAQQLGETIKTLAEQLAASELIAARREPASQRTRSSVELGKRAGSASDLSRSHSEQKVRTGFERLEQQIAAAVALDEKQEQSQRVSEGIPPPDAVRAIATATAMGGNSNSSSSSTWTMAQGETPQPRPQLPVAAGYVRSPRRQAYDNQASASVVDGTSLPAVSTPAHNPYGFARYMGDRVRR